MEGHRADRDEEELTNAQRVVARAEHHSSTHGDESRCKSERREYFLVCKNLHTVGLRPKNTWLLSSAFDFIGD